ncbi:SDR family NAD(P)-dependent oxidoreductase [Rhodovulum sulfidophilum]|uniref:SDR family NAD(P)-dependent oxidoreductase n=1 Tax=Rhodovulum sulfidophilum TaxID=35806 RepID=UPI0005A8B3A2|nr:SDR family NAD(P)-dependent oxidoreductase [Rhodovulum sulfidophilum]ANB36329.1 3-hydroxy-2-methylbutyryl-CoA dehydrogenase [Rhodovulum sulfidophilum DSM 1374]ANB40131.1 3-hydroxy-2-methylbutyryl-CoA dehydrogenase [Rhodovulum sulfidophilum]MCW2304723.1 NAD(P)-dependent dehydrogenase (short-subunit alcohol dehydrogenase family) [Rhodovulum sulfidophilum]NDK35759.1 SDR family NAD(P)-dependent oxidoreductase [Rhodovulum sulfidophilum]OLS42844.1 3-hydroxyacyl-CoA dehydrogenase [Rhodovulum sulfi
MQIENRVFLVTGAASGLGAAVAAMAVAAGGRVLLADINAEAGEAMAQELGEAARFVQTDVTSGEDGQAAVDAAVEAFGGLHVLVNCAGIAPGERLLGRNGPHGLDSFQRAITINLGGSFNMMRLAAEAMAGNEGEERGVIVNTASVAAFDGQIGQIAYAASKGGIAAMTLPAARELARHAIRVMAIAPGIFATPMMAGLPQEVQDSLGATVPYPPRLGRPEEYARMVRSIVENQMLNGEVIRLDGALRMAPK